MQPKLSLEQQLEALLFVASEPISLRQLSLATNHSESSLTVSLANLRQQLENRGIRLMQSGKLFSLVTAPAAGKIIEDFLGQGSRTELSKPALETLAIIVYDQPITKAKIEAIRGVSCDQTIKSLLARGLITEDHSTDSTTRGRRYLVSPRFLQHFGYTSIDQLPKLSQAQNST